MTDTGWTANCPPMEEALVRFVYGLRYEDLRPETLAAVSTLMRDQIALQVGCSRLPWSKQVLDYVDGIARPGESLISGTRRQLSAIDAAFVNATFGHAFEYDDAHRESASHPGSCVVSAAMAIGQERDATLAQVITALVAGYEVYTRIGNLAAPDLLKRGFQPHPVLSVFGAAAVAAKLYGFDEEQTLNALSIAMSHASGAAEFTSTGGSVKRVHSGIGTRNGMAAAAMAAAGITGPRAFLTGNKGFYRTYLQRAAGERPEGAFAPGAGFQIEKVWLKPYCCCGCNHAYIDAVRPLAARVDEITRIDARIQPSADIVVGTANAHLYAPQTIVHLQYSVPMQMALALSGLGNGFAAHFDFLEGRQDLTPVEALAQKIVLHVTPDLDDRYPGKFVADLTVTFAGGGTQEVFVEDPIGTAHNPMPRADQDWKFGESTTRVLGDAGSATLQAALDRLDPAMTARALGALCAADEG
ncbi:MAG: MmgE/PrpD family protein [Rhodobacteraceae bacterium]|nr:MmgE/PrpD family protein [Paracoccaceae bacterium]